MKSNKLLKVSASMLLALLITSSVVSGVLAKYTSDNDTMNRARVAKWGITAAADGSLFERKTQGGEYYILPCDQSRGSGLNIKLRGESEVGGEITYKISEENIFLNTGIWVLLEKETGLTAEGYTAGTYYISSAGSYILDNSSAFSSSKTYYSAACEVNLSESPYYPVVFQMKGSGSLNYVPTTEETKKVNTLKALTSAIDSALTDSTFKPNESLSSKYGLENQFITWEWEKCDTCTANGFNIENGSAADSSLCDNCKCDLILKSLMTDTSGERLAVYKNNSADSFKKPSIAAGGEPYSLGDYNLYVSFNLALSVGQSD